MNQPSFTHLHVHSQYSIMDGLSTIPELVDKAIANGMSGMALTDHGNMFGAMEFLDYVESKNSVLSNDKKFKPIIGCEMWVVKEDAPDKYRRFKYVGSHLTVLAKNQCGYKNLIQLVSDSWIEGFYVNPRTNHTKLAMHHEGLIVCSGCLGSEVAQAILSDNFEEAERLIRWYKETFGDDYYLELQRGSSSSDCVIQNELNANHAKVNDHLIRLGRKYGVKLIATNDVHFAAQEDAESHKRLVMTALNRPIEEAEKWYGYTGQEWLKSSAEMYELFQDIPEAIKNTKEIFDKVEYYSITHSQMLPKFPLPEGETSEDEYLQKVVYKGANRKYGDYIRSDIKERIENEIRTIQASGLSGYFLLFHDFIKEAKSNIGALIGPGRGAVAGSAVAYCLGITQVDPFRYGLLFERFMRSNNNCVPSIAIDIDKEHRYAVLKYLQYRYGCDNVARIVMHEIGAMPRENKKSQSSIGSKANNSHERTYVSADKYAEQICGIGVHPCSIVISPTEISKVAPIMSYSDYDGTPMLMTQYNGSYIHKAGLAVINILEHNYLSLINHTISKIKKIRGINLSIDSVPLDDEATFNLFSQGKTKNTYLFFGEKIEEYLREMRPSTFEDLVTINALARPGTIDLIDTLISRKHGLEPITYAIPEMEGVLSNTYGILVYQEQLMLLAQLLAGYSPDESNQLSMELCSNYYGDKLTLQMDNFVRRGIDKGYPENILKSIWNEWEDNAPSYFNKSHSVCYTMIAYQTAYLKANYPEEYYAAYNDWKTK